MGRNKRPSQAISSTTFPITEEIYRLPKEEDNERIKRLARKIVAFVEAEKSRKRERSEEEIDELLGIERNDIFGG